MSLRSILLGAATALGGLLLPAPAHAAHAAMFHPAFHPAFHPGFAGGFGMGFHPHFAGGFRQPGFAPSQVLALRLRQRILWDLRALGANTAFVHPAFIHPAFMNPAFGNAGFVNPALVNPALRNEAIRNPALANRNFRRNFGPGFGALPVFPWGGLGYGTGYYPGYYPGYLGYGGFPFAPGMTGYGVTPTGARPMVYSSAYYNPEEEPPSRPVAPVTTELAAGDNTAHVVVHAPPDADIRFDATLTRGAMVEQTKTGREWVSPPLAPGKDYTCDVRVRWLDNGRPVEEVRTVHLRPNTRAEVDVRPGAKKPKAP
jgi:uncharacterized protein (TIGR03000 family)